MLGRRTIGSAAIIVVFAAASAMLAFVSSALVVPVAVHVWGAPLAMVLLWTGWLLGGVSAFALGYGVGRPLVRRIVGTARMAYFEERVNERTPFSAIVLLQLALPSEIPGYALGALRYSLPRYLAALALVELPYAAATVWLGDALLRRRIVPLVAAGAVAALAAIVIWRSLKTPSGRARTG